MVQKGSLLIIAQPKVQGQCAPMQQSGQVTRLPIESPLPCVRLHGTHRSIIPTAISLAAPVHPFCSPHMVPAKPSSRTTGSRLAEHADRHQIYQLAVQSPEADVGLVQYFYRNRHRRNAWHLREDFCGTALTLSYWVQQGVRYSGEGFDIDPDPLEWGGQHNIQPLGTGAQRAILHLADARAPSSRPPDIRCAFNFSYWVFLTRGEMLDYFQKAHADLASGGMLVIDVTGGTDSLSDELFITRCTGFEMIWHQTNFSPVDHSAELALRFRFRDGSEITPYRYRWRIWSLPELLDLLEAAGFQHIDIWWQDEEAGEYGYRKTRTGENSSCWVACLAAFK